MERIFLDPSIRLPQHLKAKELLLPAPARPFQVEQTHISIVFLAGDHAYKVKKPVKFPFVDYSTLEKRKGFCSLEVELNRRLAKDVYLGVVPVAREGDSLIFEGQGEPVEYAVKMRRLPEEARLNRWLESGRLPPDFWDRLAGKLSDFYTVAGRGPEISRWALPPAVREDWDQIFGQIGAFPEDLLPPELFGKIFKIFHEEWYRQAAWIQNRLEKARDGHGDLRMEHIYWFPEDPPPNDILVIDCVEFDPRYRCCDPLSDLAFLAMDLEARGFAGEVRRLLQTWLRRSGDEDGDLFSFFTAYRHLVRGLVRGLQALQGDLDPVERARARGKTRLHFLMALGRLASPSERPCLVLMMGLPGSGKSSLAEALGTNENFRVFSSDRVRKELTGVPDRSRAESGFREGIYGFEWTERTYAALARMAENALAQGERVLIDATFSDPGRRAAFHDLAHQLGVPFVLFTCRASEATIRKRLLLLERHGSDADWEVFQRLAPAWREPPLEWEGIDIDTEPPLLECLHRARTALASLHLSNLDGPEER